MNTQYANPLIISPDNQVSPLQKLLLSGDKSAYNETFIQKLAFAHPQCLPVNEIDRAFEGLIPVCMELNTSAGPLDILYVTPKGRLAVVEAKLWRNPEARRKVIGQVLDYAKELSHWDYEDLQREVSRATGRKGNVLYQIVADLFPETDEALFVDEVTRTLADGRFMLLILGDGIREGVAAIAQFLEQVGTLEFVFGLVELALFRCPDQSLLVQPRVLAKTTIFNRVVVNVARDRARVETPAETEEEAELLPYEKFYLAFWPELMAELKLDDPSQPLPRTQLSKGGNIFFPMPPPGGHAWLTCYFSQADKGCGVFLTFTRGTFGDELYKGLLEQRADIDSEIGLELAWQSDGSKHKIAYRHRFGDLFADANRPQIKVFFTDTINRFVNAFRHRLERLAREMQA
jgi:hypothetical protein